MTTVRKDDEHRDNELAELMATIVPTPHRLAQIEDAVLATVKPRAERVSLTAEWFELLKVRPLFTSGLALAGSAALLLLSPTSGILAALLGVG